MGRKLYNIKETAILIGVSESTLRLWYRRGLYKPLWGVAGGEIIPRKREYKREGYVFDSNLIKALKRIKEDQTDSRWRGHLEYCRSRGEGLQRV